VILDAREEGSISIFKEAKSKLVFAYGDL